VGVIRRVTARSPLHRSVGVEILARGGVCVDLAPLPTRDGVLPLRGILLPTEAQTSLAGGEVELVLPRGSTARLASCELLMHGRPYRIERRRIADSGSDFEIARFALPGA
jgi:hypothetical protein